MAALSIDQLLALAAAAGFSGSDLATAVAVALAESGGNPQAYNPERGAGAAQGKGSYGLWQIYLTAHPEYSPANLIDPAYNAAAAFAVYQSAGGFTPWSTFKNGAYLGQLAAVNSVISASQSQDQVASTDSSGDGGGFTPGGGDTLAMFAIGALVLWVLLR